MLANTNSAESSMIFDGRLSFDYRRCDGATRPPGREIDHGARLATIPCACERLRLHSRSFSTVCRILAATGCTLRNVARISFLLVGSEKHAAQHLEKPRKKSSLNYKSAALPTELCRRLYTKAALTSSSTLPYRTKVQYRITLVGALHGTDSLPNLIGRK